MIFLITTLIIAVFCGSTAYFCEKHNSSPQYYLKQPLERPFMQASLNKKAEQDLTDFLNSLPDLPELIYLFYQQSATDILLNKQKAITTFVQKGDKTHFESNLKTIRDRYDNQLKELLAKAWKK